MTFKPTSGRRSDDLYEELRRLIVTGELRPNEPLIEVDLAAQLQVSRTPVRECLQRLFAAGLVVPRKRGWSVREFTAEYIWENAEVRAGLEGYAAHLAAERGTPAQIETICALHAARLELRSVDDELRVKTNREFHDAVIQASGNQRMMDAIYNLGQFYFNAPVARLTTEGELAQGNADHALIVDAIVAHDGPRAEKAMRSHIYRTFSVYARVLNLPTARSEAQSGSRKAP
jgi:DNA-binding GntR family transcriptional regulator